MTNPTSNYGFVLPTSTDLVTDLPADFDVALQGVDTRLKALQPGTTLGDIAYSSATANTNTRLPIGTSGQVLAVSGGGVPAWTTTADVTPLTTKGDLFTFDTADARLGVGTNGQTLVADSSTATGLKWDTPASGGWTSIASGTLSGASVSLTSIPSTYKNLTIYLNNPYASTTADFRFTINSDTANNYTFYSWNSAFTTQAGGGEAFVRLGATGSLITANNNYGSGTIQFPNYYSTTGIKLGTVQYQGSAGSLYSGYWTSNQGYVITAISSIQLKTSTGTFSGGTYELWGQK